MKSTQPRSLSARRFVLTPQEKDTTMSTKPNLDLSRPSSTLDHWQGWASKSDRKHGLNNSSEIFQRDLGEVSDVITSTSSSMTYTPFSDPIGKPKTMLSSFLERFFFRASRSRKLSNQRPSNDQCHQEKHQAEENLDGCSTYGDRTGDRHRDVASIRTSANDGDNDDSRNALPPLPTPLIRTDARYWLTSPMHRSLFDQQRTFLYQVSHERWPKTEPSANRSILAKDEDRTAPINKSSRPPMSPLVYNDTFRSNTTQQRKKRVSGGSVMT